jgi:LmbE family N-acetylglucosaminyl deacetylase
MDLDPLLGRTLVLVAHPDDEAICSGGLLQRMREPIVIFATDGAPRDSFFWSRFGSRDAYAAVRAGEARQALHAAGVEHYAFLADKDVFIDQELFRSLDPAAGRLLDWVRHFRAEAILTLAYEGGHPDHDACSFLAACVGREFPLDVWEMPAYHRSTDGVAVRQEFLSVTDDAIALELTTAELARKRTICAAYESQCDVLAEFQLDIERFRPQPAYDFTRPPHPGVLNYEAWKWPMTGAELCAEFQRCLSGRSGERREASA